MKTMTVETKKKEWVGLSLKRKKHSWSCDHEPAGRLCKECEEKEIKGDPEFSLENKLDEERRKRVKVGHNHFCWKH